MKTTTANKKDYRQAMRFLVVLFLAAGMVATISLSAHGQQYDVIKLDAKYDDPAGALKTMRDAAKRISVTREKSIPNLNAAKYFYQTYVPAKVTQVGTGDAAAQAAPLVSEVVARLNAAQRSGATNANLIMKWMYDGFKPITVGNYHPTARINAILVIGGMDRKIVDRRTKTAPEPLSLILVDFLPIYEDKNNPDGVRAAALQSLHRYVRFAPSIPAASAAKLKTLMSNLLKEDPPKGRSVKAHAYLQRYAVDILSVLRGEKDAGLGQQLISISAEAKKPDLIALHSAARIGSMSADLKDNLNAPDEVLRKWAVRAMRSFQDESDRLKALDRPSPAAKQPQKPEGLFRPNDAAPATAMGTEGMMEAQMENSMDESNMMEGAMEGMMEDSAMEMGFPGMGGVSKVNPQPPEVLVSRRKLNYVIQQLHLGATGTTKPGVPDDPGGMLGAATDDQKEAIETWIKDMGEVLTALNDETLDSRKTYIEGLDAQVEALRKIAGAAVEQADKDAPRTVAGLTPEMSAKVAEMNALVAEPSDGQPAEAGNAASSTVGNQPILNNAGIPQFPPVDELSE